MAEVLLITSKYSVKELGSFVCVRAIVTFILDLTINVKHFHLSTTEIFVIFIQTLKRRGLTNIVLF